MAAKDPVKDGRKYAVSWCLLGVARKEQTALSFMTPTQSDLREDKSSSVTNPRKVEGALHDPWIQAQPRAEEEDEEEDEKEEKEEEEQKKEEEQQKWLRLLSLLLLVWNTLRPCYGSSC